MIDRRTVLTAGSLALAAWPVLAQAPEELMKTLERRTGGRIGVYARNLDTGAQIAWRADERFVMCSTFKASLAACVLSRVDKGQETLGRVVHYTKADLAEYAPTTTAHVAAGGLPVGELCKAAVELSDNTAANLLLAQIGGPAALTAFWRSIGDTTSRLDHNEPMLNRSPPGDPHDTTTPRAMAENLQRMVLGKALSPASRERLTDWMIACSTGANRLRAGLPKAWMVGDKTGNNGKDAAGDIAVAWPKPGAPVLICVYTQGGAPTPEALTEAFTGIGRLVGQRLHA
jgi:beta-lactamase class A